MPIRTISYCTSTGDAQERLGEPVELPARLRPRPRRGVAPHLREGVEDAPLAPRPGPRLPEGLGEAVPAVGDDHLGRRDARHQRRPRPAVLGAAQVPAQGTVKILAHFPRIPLM